MWFGKFKIKHERDWIAPRTKKFNITAVGIPLNNFSKNKKKFHGAVIFINGDEKNKKAFIKSLEKEKSVKKLEVKNNQIIVLLEGKNYTANFFNPELFFIKPVLIKKGFEYWEIGSWNRKNLTEFIDKIEKFAKIDILSLTRKVPEIFIQTSVPKLTNKQRNFFEIAKLNGYYEYPRKISLKDLARKIKVPRTTLRNHLRKAEFRIFNVMLE